MKEILESTRIRIERAKKELSAQELKKKALKTVVPLSMYQALQKNSSYPIIAEIKRASPSEGMIRQDFDPIQIASNYLAHGAAALSVLTEPEFFKGDLSFLKSIRSAHPKAILLRKDFIFDPYQILEARAYGANAILLISKILSEEKIRELVSVAQEMGLDVLMETHTEKEFHEALEGGMKLIGFNHRDLSAMKVNLDASKFLEKEKTPPDVCLVAESGIRGGEDLVKLRARGFHAFLAGTALMRAPDPGEELSTWVRNAER